MKIFHLTARPLALAFAIAVAPAANATLVLSDGTVFNGYVSGSGSSYQLTLRMDFTNTAVGSQYLGDRIEAWSLQLPGAATSTLIGAPLDLNWAVYGTGKAVGGNSGCGNGNVTTICVDRVDNTALQGTGPVVTNAFFDWVIAIQFAAPQAFSSGGNFHLLTVEGDDKKGEWKKGGGLISLDLGALLTCQPNPSGGACEVVPPPPPPPPPPNPPADPPPGPPGSPPQGDPPSPANTVPEPGSLALLGLGALAAGVFRRRRSGGTPGQG